MIAFTYAALNGLDVCAGDIRNAYLQTPSSQKDYIVCSSEFCLENVGHVALIHRALYRGKCAGLNLRNHLRLFMRHLDLTSCLVNPTLWTRPVKESDDSLIEEYILLYIHDALVVGEIAETTLRNDFGRYLELIHESIGPQSIYLGGKVCTVKLTSGGQCWAFSSSQPVNSAVNDVEEYLSTQDKWIMPAKADTHLPTPYRSD